MQAHGPWWPLFVDPNPGGTEWLLLMHLSHELLMRSESKGDVQIAQSVQNLVHILFRPQTMCLILKIQQLFPADTETGATSSVDQALDMSHISFVCGYILLDVQVQCDLNNSQSDFLFPSVLYLKFK